jgi:hypothetical protein
VSLKDLVVNFDEGITKSFITDLYHWSMRFSHDDSIKGDFDVVAKGASSLVAKEVRAQNLSMFVSTLQPEQRGIIKWSELTEQQGDVLDLKNIVMSKEEIEEQQQSPMAKMQEQLAQVQQQLQVALVQSQLAESQAKAAKAQAEAMNSRLESAYTAMQTAGVAAQNPTIAPAGDAILRSAGWVDQDQQAGTGAELAQGQVSPEMQQQVDNREMAAPNPAVGQQAGIETQQLG